MNQSPNKQFQRTVQHFQKQKHKLPVDISWKLQYMIDYINNKAKPLAQLSEQQRNQVKDLQDMTPQALKCVFTYIVNSILNPNLYCSFEKNCKMKVQGLMSRWVKVYVSFADDEIVFTSRKKIFKFVLQELECHRVSETELEFKYRGVKKSKIKFQHKQAALNMYAKIQQMIHNYLKNKKQLDNNQEQIIYSKLFLQSLAQDYVVSYVNKSKQNRFQAHKKLPRIHGHFWDIYHLMEFIVRQNLWNSKAVEERFIENSCNKILIQRRLKSSSFFSLQRKTITEVKIFQMSQNCFLVQQQSYQGDINTKSIVSDIYIKTILDILSPKIVKITMDCTYNAKGYCNTSDSRSMLIDLFSDYVFLEDRYTKLKNRNKLHFSMNLKNFIHKKQKLNEKEDRDFLALNSVIKDNNQYPNKEEPLQQYEHFYSIASNSKNFQIQEQQKGDFNDQFQNNFVCQFFDNQQSNNQQDSRIKTNSSIKMEKREKQKKEVRVQNIQKNEQSLFIQFQNIKPHNYDQKIAGQYIKLLKQRVHEKYYLGKRFLQQQKLDFLADTPWYDPSIIIPDGHEYKVSEKNQLVFINYQLIQGQKDSLIFVIKQVGANLISGKSVLNVSLPVDIFQSRSLLQRSCASFGCAPKFLKPAADLDVNQQLKAVMGFMLSVAPLQLIMLKPFNPILGQTFQAYLGGVPICYEQISHHPPISSYYMTCSQFTLYGNLVAVANVSLNSGSGGNSGKMFIRMRNGNEFQLSFFPGQISGLIYGKRKYSICKKAFVVQRKNRLVAQISSYKQSKGLYQWKSLNIQPTIGDIIGRIFKVKQKFLKENPPNKSMMNHTGLKKEDIESKLQFISGLWFSKVKVGQQIINNNITAYPVQYSNQLLPSDSNYRMDVLMHRFGDLARSQSQKEVLQGYQRNDKKLRQSKEQKVKK